VDSIQRVLTGPAIEACLIEALPLNIPKVMAAKPTSKRISRSHGKPDRTKSTRSKPIGQKSRSKALKKNPDCPIVGIGGSAGGFEAAMDLLRHLSPRTGMAFVIVQHHGSQPANLLGKATSMPVTEVTKTTTPQPNAVYVQPPNKCVIAKNGKLILVNLTERLNVAIDHFFESLAEECGSRAIGIVPSGTGSDGTVSLRAIKAAGGLTFAQTEESAKFDAVLRSATAFIDLSERKHHEQQLAEQARLLDLSNDAIIVRDKDERITYWNRGATKLYGYTRQEALGAVIQHLLKSKLPEPLPKMHEKLLRNNHWQGELVHTRRDGTRLTVFSRWALDRDAQGRRAYVLEQTMISANANARSSGKR
jgi:PAS domain S-box-containing protein